MNRRNFLRGLALAPLAPVAAKLALLEGPAPIATTTATDFGTLSPAAKKVWSRALWAEAQRESAFADFVRSRGHDNPIFSGAKRTIDLL